MGTRERREREREEVKTKILDAARELFASAGYEATTLRRIAERIEYSPTAIYLHFPDKEAVLRALCDLDFYSLAVELRQMAEIADPLARLRAIAMGYVEFGLTHPNHYRLMFMTPHPAMKSASESELEHGNPEEDAYAFLRWTVEQSIAEGRLRPEYADSEATAQIAWAAVHGVVSLFLAKQNDDWVAWQPPRTLAALMVEAILHGMVQPDAGSRRRVAKPARPRQPHRPRRPRR